MLWRWILTTSCSVVLPALPSIPCPASSPVEQHSPWKHPLLASQKAAFPPIPTTPCFKPCRDSSPADQRQQLFAVAGASNICLSHCGQGQGHEHAPGFFHLAPIQVTTAKLVPGASTKDMSEALLPRSMSSLHVPGNSSTWGILRDKRSSRNVRDYLVLIINYGLSCLRVWNRSQNLHQGGQDSLGNSKSLTSLLKYAFHLSSTPQLKSLSGAVEPRRACLIIKASTATLIKAPQPGAAAGGDAARALRS